MVVLVAAGLWMQGTRPDVDTGLGLAQEVLEEERAASLDAEGPAAVPTEGDVEVPQEVASSGGEGGGEGGSMRAAVGDALVLRVVGPQGRPLEGAMVSLNPLENDVLGFFPEDRWTDWLFLLGERTQRLMDEAVVAVTDSEGRAELERPEGGDWILWASSSRAVAAQFVRSAGGATDWPTELQLSVGLGGRATVVGSDGRAVPGARVVQQALLPDDGGTPDDPGRLVRRALVRGHEAGADGGVALAAFGGRQLVWAEVEGQRSAPVMLGEDGDVRLQVGEVFELVTQARGLDGAVLEPWAMLAVHALVGGEEVLVAAVSHGPDSAALLDVPLVTGAEGYLARIAMGGNEFAERSFGVPAARERVELEFEFRLGIKHWMAVVDKAAPTVGIGGARVTYRWTAVDGSPAARTATTAPHGWAYLVGIPVGVDLYYDVEAAGYAPSRSEAFRLAAGDADQGLEAHLSKGARLRIRVVEDGEPVEVTAFASWPEGAASATEMHREAELGADGWYSVDAAPAEAAYVVALDGLGPLGPVGSLVEAEPGLLEATIEVGGARAGVGRILDAHTLEAIEGASVELASVSETGAAIVVPVRAVESGRDGRFRVERVVDVRAAAVVRAEGYAGSWATTAEFGENGAFEFGDVFLEPVRRARVRLEGTDSRGYEQYFLTPGEQLTTEVGLRFDGEGLAAVDLGPNGRQLSIRHPGGDWDRVMLREVAGTEEIAIDVATEATMRVRIVDETGAPVEVTGSINARFEQPAGFIDRGQAVVEPRSQIELAAPPAGPLQVLWTPPRGEFGSGQVALDWDPARGDMVELVVRRDSAPRFVVTSPGGEPLAGVLVLQARIGAVDLQRDYSTGRTDGEGRAAVMFPDEEPLNLALLGADGSLVVGLTAGPRVEGEALPLVLDAPHGLEVRVHDDGAAVAGAALVLQTPGQVSLLGQLYSGEDGIAQREGLGAGAYTIAASALGRFPVEVDMLVPGGRVDIELRRLGGLDVEARFSDGGVPAGAGVTVESTEGLGAVADWMAEGRVPLVELRLDGQGRLGLDGLPHGSYRVRVEGVGEALADVVALERSRVVVLP